MCHLPGHFKKIDKGEFQNIDNNTDKNEIYRGSYMSAN